MADIFFEFLFHFKYVCFANEPWTEIATDEKTRIAREDMLNDASLLLPLIFFGGEPDERFDILFKKEFLSKLLGTFQLVNVDINYDFPLDDALSKSLRFQPKDVVEFFDNSTLFKLYSLLQTNFVVNIINVVVFV